MIPTNTHDPQNKINHNRRQKRQRKHRRPKPIVEASLATHPDTLSSPVECDQCVEHSGECDQCEETGRDLSDFVAEVEKTYCEAAEDDGEVEPGKEGTLVGEEDFGLDAGGEGDTLAFGSVNFVTRSEGSERSTHQVRFEGVVGSTWWVVFLLLRRVLSFD